MLGSCAVISFIGVSDLARAGQFYGQTLGLHLADESPYALVGEVGGRMLRITAVGNVVAAPYTVLGWDVPDIDAAIEELRAREVRFTHYDGMDQDERGVWIAPSGAKVAWFFDPDGNTLSLTEFAARSSGAPGPAQPAG